MNPKRHPHDYDIGTIVTDGISHFKVKENSGVRCRNCYFKRGRICKSFLVCEDIERKDKKNVLFRKVNI